MPLFVFPLSLEDKAHPFSVVKCEPFVSKFQDARGKGLCRQGVFLNLIIKEENTPFHFACSSSAELVDNLFKAVMLIL